MTRPLIATTGTVLDTTNGGKGYERTPKGELFIAAVSSFAESNSDRIRELTGQVTLDDPAWVLRFGRWLRDEGNMRMTPIEVACAFVHGRLEAGVKDETGPGPATGLNRTAINVACLRADEPAKLIEYWRKVYGRKLPTPVKRGVADAVRRLYTEWAALKYDGSSNEMRMGDVIELTHPRASGPAQGALFEYLINRRHGWRRSDYLFPLLPMVAENERLRAMNKGELRDILLGSPELLKDAGMTWENLSSLGAMNAEAWEAVIPSMGYMSLLRNLRNFDHAGVSDVTVKHVQDRLSDRAQVQRSRQFPFRFYSAYLNSDRRWADTLEQALEYSLENIPRLDGNTLILVDCSVSMRERVSDKSDVRRIQQAALFGTALALRCENPTLVKFGATSEEVTQHVGVLKTVSWEFPYMGGTQTTLTVQEWLARDPAIDRVVIVTDEQANDTRGQQGSHLSVSDVIPDHVMLYSWNLGGKRVAHAEAGGNKHEFGGLSDQCFKLIKLIESGTDATWPF